VDERLCWLDRFEALGLDGVIAKKLGVPCRPGSRDGVVKIKEHKTADCVVVGVRWKEDRSAIATLLLGLYRDDGGLDYVGSAAVAASTRKDVAERVLPLLDEKSDRRFSEPNRWGTGGRRRAGPGPRASCGGRCASAPRAGARTPRTTASRRRWPRRRRSASGRRPARPGRGTARACRRAARDTCAAPRPRGTSPAA